MSISSLSWEVYNHTPWGVTVLQFSLRTASASLLYMPSPRGTTGLHLFLVGTCLCHKRSCETPQFQYWNHETDCRVQCKSELYRTCKLVHTHSQSIKLSQCIWFWALGPTSTAKEGRVGAQYDRGQEIRIDLHTYVCTYIQRSMAQRHTMMLPNKQAIAVPTEW